MFKFPTDVLHNIYAYDSTYKEIYDKAMEELIPKEIKILDVFFEKNYMILDRYSENRFKIYNFNESEFGIITVLTEEEAIEKVKENIQTNIEYHDSEFLSIHTGLSTQAIKILKHHSNKLNLNAELKNIIKNMETFVSDIIKKDGLYNYLSVIYDVDAINCNNEVWYIVFDALSWYEHMDGFVMTY